MDLGVPVYEDHSKSMNSATSKHWQLLFGLWTMQGGAAFSWLILIPTDTENPVAFGFSAARVVLISIAAALTFASLLLWFQGRRASFQTWLTIEKHDGFWDLSYLASLFAATAALVFLVTNALWVSDAYRDPAARFVPIVLWFGLSGLELTLFIALARYGRANQSIKTLQPLWKATLILIVVFSLLAVFIAITKIGVTPGPNWGDPPIPFFEWQVFLVLMLTAGLAFFPQAVSKYKPGWIPFAIYIFTVTLWLSQPVNPAFTATAPRPPNFEVYPFSDPQFYAQYAQSALIGNGFLWPDVPARPFYVALLTWLHLLGNQNYQNIIVLQTFGLALFPVVLYFFGKEIGGRPLGLGLALLAAFRDLNSNLAVGFASNVTNSKLFLSELPTALLVSLAALLSIRWLRMTNRPVWLPLLIGSVLGAASLIRLQSSILILLMICLAFFVVSNRRDWWKGSTFMVIGFIVAMAPWLMRNYLATGGLVLDNPISQTMTMARRWSGDTGNEILPPLPNENVSQYSSRLTKMAVANFIEHPGFILGSAANHFINSEIASLLAFPARDHISSPSELLWPQHTFWKTPLVAAQIPLLGFYLLLFSLGVAAAWHYHGLLGLLPLGVGMMYNAWTALFFSSGARFVVPVDWSVHLYELFGLLLLGALALSFTKGGSESISSWIRMPFPPPPVNNTSLTLSRRNFVLSLIVVMALGSFLPITESIFPQKYPPKSQAEILSEIGMTVREGETALYGRAVYPRYYGAKDGEPGTAKLGYGKDEKARLVFLLIGPQSSLVIFELENAPSFFPHTSDVYMIGTQMDGYFAPRVVKVMKDSQTQLYINK